MVVRLHHVEIRCQNLQQSLRQLCGHFGFRVLASSSFPNRVTLNRDSINFVLSEGAGERDTVYNVALEVKDVKNVVDNVERNDGKIIKRPETLADSNGVVESAVIQTPVGNVVHTLLNASGYNGVFLPGFHRSDKRALREGFDYVTPSITSNKNTVIGDRILTHFDHITFACSLGTSQAIMKWYERCFGFSRFNISSDEKSDGFIVQSSIQGASIGMKLAAMQYWFCSESELRIDTDEPGGGVKFVFAEPLPGQEDTSDEINLTSQEDKVQEIRDVGESVESLQKHGILLDAESFTSSKSTASSLENMNVNQDADNKYLMQVFTRPLFNKETFFLEVIQRCGATGFGAGNITALWKAVDSYLNKKI
ncbi:hypothetical protein pdam_00012363 [Pocillopora damicornis]|uniref:VOC domain-containing protein n=1 Tax=Pocillopora damicornis TaxID=46731 RepID=A0A3M6TIK4_POCDA|nr:4-hydroxyphenylpyruvate dioxygenase-like protein [Pocillopora damicornis]RMX41252.1 hypothetical protein pdam_00012363 [Pocillopora damicornis]